MRNLLRVLNNEVQSQLSLAQSMMERKLQYVDMIVEILPSGVAMIRWLEWDKVPPSKLGRFESYRLYGQHVYAMLVLDNSEEENVLVMYYRDVDGELVQNRAITSISENLVNSMLHGLQVGIDDVLDCDREIYFTYLDVKCKQICYE